MELTQFLKYRISDDGFSAYAAGLAAPTPWEASDRGWIARLYRAGSDWSLFGIEQGVLENPNPGDLVRHFERFNPDRVDIDCSARQAIVKRCEPYTDTQVRRQTRLLANDVLRLLALPYRDHKDYDQEWADEAS